MLHPHEGGLGASAPPAPHCSNPALSPDLGIADRYRKIESSPMLGKLTAKATESRPVPFPALGTPRGGSTGSFPTAESRALFLASSDKLQLHGVAAGRGGRPQGWTSNPISRCPPLRPASLN